MSKQTAVEWLIDKLSSQPIDDINDEYWFGIIGQAKQMEKEQIIESYRDGRSDQQSERLSKFYNRTAEQYYNNEK